MKTRKEFSTAVLTILKGWRDGTKCRDAEMGLDEWIAQLRVECWFLEGVDIALEEAFSDPEPEPEFEPAPRGEESEFVEPVIVVLEPEPDSRSVVVETPGGRSFTFELPLEAEPEEGEGDESAPWIMDMEFTEPDVIVYTDGSCLRNPGPAGCGVVISCDSSEEDIEFFCSIGEATNNVAELSGVLEALRAIRTKGVRVSISTDSEYCKNVLSGRYGAKKNVELIDEIKALRDEFREVTFSWVKGHDGNPRNEQADKLARMGADESAAKEEGKPSPTTEPDPDPEPKVEGESVLDLSAEDLGGVGGDADGEPLGDFLGLSADDLNAPPEGFDEGIGELKEFGMGTDDDWDDIPEEVRKHLF
jgi:ribonuclease HI